MNISDLFALVISYDKYSVPYNFYISKYPVAITEDNKVRIGNPDDHNLYRTTWKTAMRFCNSLSRKNGLKPAYSEKQDETEAEDIISICAPTQQSLRLPTPQEWDCAAHGWSGSRTGDYFSIQKKYFKVPFLDYPTTDEQVALFEKGYATIDQLIENSIGIYGMLVYAREWCAPIDKFRGQRRQGIKWEEYYMNYNNDIGYQTVTFDAQDQEALPFRVVLPCQDSAS